MKAIVQTKYGSPSVLRLADVDRPIVLDHQVLVKVHGTSVHAGDWHLMRGTPFLVRLIYGGISEPKIKILGCDIAGEVEAVGKNVTQFQVGDRVFGDLSEHGFGAFAEYVSVSETALAPSPSNLTDGEAATIPVSALTALQALRDRGKIRPGQKVLINGASGGVGSFAVQIAKAFGAEVTGICSTPKMAMVERIGADLVVDRAQSSLLKNYYDLMIDTAAYHSVFKYLPHLKPTGTYVMVGGSTKRIFQVMLFGWIFSILSNRQVKFLAANPNQQDLICLKEMIEQDQIKPYIDRYYSLSQLPSAIQDLEERRVSGKISIEISSNIP